MSEKSLLLSKRSRARSSLYVPPTGAAGHRIPSVMGALVAIGKSVGVSVVEQRVVPVTPGKFLQANRASDIQEVPAPLAPRRRAEAHLGADAQVGVRHEFGLLVRVLLRLHVGVGHADADAGERQNDGQDLPGPRCGETGSD